MTLASASWRQNLRRRLLAWFKNQARDLPWRRTREAYPIWISEVMLQQTQVATVVPYFDRFMKRFPNLATLAQADEDEVLRFWEGLGYYRRARALHRSAQIVLAEHEGVLPTDPTLLQLLPGFGRYTANAVLSQAYDQRLPILEANSRRLLCRLLGIRGDPSKADVQANLWEAATVLLPKRHAGDFNQALMELGSLICSPESPSCGECPLQLLCHAAQHGLQTEIPYAAPRQTATQVAEIALVARQNERVLLVQRPAEGRWGNMWEFPRREQENLESPISTGQNLLKELGLQGEIINALATIKHTVTRFRITLTCLEARITDGAFKNGRYVAGKWIAPTQLADYPFSTPQRRLAKIVYNEKS